MEKINELLNGIDVYALNISGHVPVHIKDNIQTGYLYVQTQLLTEILKELKELKTEKVEVKSTTKTTAKTTTKEEK